MDHKETYERLMSAGDIRFTLATRLLPIQFVTVKIVSRLVEKKQILRPQTFEFKFGATSNLHSKTVKYGFMDGINMNLAVLSAVASAACATVLQSSAPRDLTVNGK
jgi:hypothetical protein